MVDDQWDRFARDVGRILADALRRMDNNGLTQRQVVLRHEAAEARQSIRERAA